MQVTLKGPNVLQSQSFVRSSVVTTAQKANTGVISIENIVLGVQLDLKRKQEDKISFENMIMSNKDILTNLFANLQNQRGECNRFAALLDSEKEKLRHAESKLPDISAKIDYLINDEFTSYNEIKTLLETTLARFHEDLNMFIQLRDSYLVNIANLKDSIAVSEGEYDRLNAIIKEKEIEIATVNNLVEDLKLKLCTITNEVVDMEAKILHQQAVCAQLQEEISKEKELKLCCEDRIKTVMADTDMICSTIELDMKEHGNSMFLLHEKLLLTERELQEYERTCALKTASNEELCQEIENLFTSLGAVRAESTHLMELKSSLENQSDNLREDILKLESSCESERKIECELLKVSNDRAAEVAKIQQTFDSLSRTAQGLRNENVTMVAEKAKWKQIVTEIAQETFLESEVLKNDVLKAEVERESIMCKFINTSEKLARMERELNDVERSVAVSRKEYEEHLKSESKLFYEKQLFDTNIREYHALLDISKGLQSEIESKGSDLQAYNLKLRSSESELTELMNALIDKLECAINSGETTSFKVVPSYTKPMITTPNSSKSGVSSDDFFCEINTSPIVAEKLEKLMKYSSANASLSQHTQPTSPRYHSKPSLIPRQEMNSSLEKLTHLSTQPQISEIPYARTTQNNFTNYGLVKAHTNLVKPIKSCETKVSNNLADIPSRRSNSLAPTFPQSNLITPPKIVKSAGKCAVASRGNNDVVKPARKSSDWFFDDDL